LALFDLVMALEIPMLIANSFVERILGWNLGCDIYAALGSVSGIGSAITNAAIAYDRYRYVHSKSIAIARNYPFFVFFNQRDNLRAFLLPFSNTQIFSLRKMYMHLAACLLMFAKRLFSLFTRTISCPIDGRLNGKQAAVIVAFTWFWTMPFTILPFTKVWGRFATGDNYLLFIKIYTSHFFTSYEFSFTIYITYYN
jgi:hypothetical protein